MRLDTPNKHNNDTTIATMKQPITSLSILSSFVLLPLLFGVATAGADGEGTAASQPGCPVTEPEPWSPCQADQAGVSCNLGEEYGGDRYCWKDCDGNVWTHLCAGGPDLPPPPEEPEDKPPMTKFECSSLTDCASCLDHPACDGWSGGFGCYSTCSYDSTDPQSFNVADVPCYDAANGGCEAESTNNADYRLCSQQTTCDGCMATSKSGGSSCLWMATDFGGDGSDGFCTNTQGMMCCPVETCPAQTAPGGDPTTGDDVADTDAAEQEGQFDDIIADCGAEIGAGVACFTTSQEPACEGFDPMSLLAGDLPIPDNCEEGAELACGVLVGCCDQEIVDIASCAARSNLGLDCDIDCSGGGPTPTPAPGTTSGGPGIIKTTTATGLLGVFIALLLLEPLLDV